jgi:hypothetical protein
MLPSSIYLRISGCARDPSASPHDGLIPPKTFAMLIPRPSRPSKPVRIWHRRPPSASAWIESQQLSLVAVAVAQTIGHNVFLYVCDKTTILGRVISVSEGPCRPPEAIL